MGIISSQLCKIIEWSDNSKDTLVYKFPMNGRKIMFGSSLTVRESQCAIFVNKGQVADVFQPGMYKLSSSNLPFLSNILGLKYGFKSPFQAEVYYVNTKQFTNQKWGTSNPITMRDPEFGAIRVRGFGTYSFRVAEAFTLMKELFGTNSTFKTEDIAGQLKSKIVSEISEILASSGLSALDLTSNLSAFETQAKDKLDVGFQAMGLRLSNFQVENISFPEEVEKALDMRASMGVMKGEMGTFTQYQTAHAIRDAANNQNGGAGVGASMGAGMAMAGMFNQAINQNAQGAAAAQTAAPASSAGKCSKCKNDVPSGAKFCPGCGSSVASSFCSSCGAKVNSGAKFCPNCGKKQ